MTDVTISEIDMSWQDNAGHQADGYKILRATNHGTFSQVATLPPTSRTPPSTYLWSDTNLSAGTFYEYHIIAYNVSGNNDFAGVNATTITLPPSGVSATPGNAVVTLSWTAPTGAQTYNLYRATTSGQETAFAAGLTATSYTDNAVSNGTTYYYTVTAVNANTSITPVIPSESAPSAEVSATPTLPPPAPTNLKAAGTPRNQGTAQVSLSWTASSTAANYNVYRSLNGNGEGGTPLATGVTATSYTDTSAAFGPTYFYKVTAVNAGGESPLSHEASTTPLLAVHLHFTSDATEAPAGYLADVGRAYAARTNALTYGWNQDNTAAMRDRDSTASPDELHDGLGHMQKPDNPNAWWGLAVPNGTYSVTVLAGDPDFIDSIYRINVGATLSGTTFSGGVLAISGTPTATNHWFARTVTVTVAGGVLYVSNAPRSSNNKIDAIDIVQVLPGGYFSAGRYTGNGGLTYNGSASLNANKLELTNGGNNQAGSIFTASPVDVAKFTANFSFQLTSANADGFTFALQSAGATALGATGGGLGYQGISPSVAIKFDLYNNRRGKLYRSVLERRGPHYSLYRFDRQRHRPAQRPRLQRRHDL